MSRLGLAVRVSLLGVATLALGACPSTGPGRSLAFEISAQREIWDAQGFSEYTYALGRSCFCPPSILGPVRIEVGASGVRSRRYAETDLLVEASLEELYPDIDGLFDFLLEAIERDAHRIDVVWHATLGYPIEAYVDYMEFAADEEQGFQVTEVPTRAGQR